MVGNVPQSRSVPLEKAAPARSCYRIVSVPSVPFYEQAQPLMIDVACDDACPGFDFPQPYTASPRKVFVIGEAQSFRWAEHPYFRPVGEEWLSLLCHGVSLEIGFHVVQA